MSKEQLDKVNKNAGKIQQPRKTDVSNLKKFVNWSKNKSKESREVTKEKIRQCSSKGKNCVSNVGKKINKVKTGM